MNVTIRTFALCAIPMWLSMVVGCAPDTGADDGDDWTLGPDAGADATPPPGEDASDSDDPYATSFRLENAGERPVRVQLVRDCGRTPPGWVEPDTGAGSVDGGGCQTCKCENVDQNGCGVCAAPEVCAVPKVQEVAAGSDVSWEWSGERFLDENVEGWSCKRRETPDVGESMEATFCWSAAPGPTGSEVEFEETTCETVDFSYGEQTTVTHTVSPENESQPTEFILENRAGFSVDVTDPSICTTVDDPWLSVFPAGDVEMDLTTDCTVCSCAEAENEFCGACDRACPKPSPSGLASGEQESYLWNGVGHARREVEGQTCHEQMNFRPGQTLTAEFCWREPYARNGDGAETTSCETTTFEYGQETVRHTIEPGPRETTFELRNTSGSEIRIQRAENCQVNPPGWMTVRRDGNRPLINRPCGCSCDEAETNETCGPCTRECAVDRVEAIEADSSAIWTWEGLIYETAEEDDQMCIREHVPSPGEQLSVEFCWSAEDGPTGTDHRLDDETCQTVDFEYGESPKVLHRILGR